MKLNILYFASLREQLGKGAEEIDATAPTVDALRSELAARGGAYHAVFAGNKLVRAAVNQEMVAGSAMLKAGDEVAFFPPVTGG